MNFDEALKFLAERTDYERFGGGARPGNDRIRALVESLAHPERSFRSIHVTGTNGKFSTVTMATEILAELGLTVGAYTSPHLESIRERIAVGGEPISQDAFARVLEYLAPYIEIVEAEAGELLTHFDTLTAMALEHFFDQAVHAAVIEVGLGGEYDSTNVVDAEVAVITRVHRDHLREFGDDLERAAWEKAGIVKDGSVVLSGVDQPELAAIVEERARERGASRLAVLGREFGVESRSLAVGGQALVVRGLHAVYDDLFLPVFGPHQATNAAFAIAAVEAFAEGPLHVDAVRDAFVRVRMPARLEVQGRHPLVVVDGGHNEDAARAVIEALRTDFAYARLILVIGMLGDKPVEEVAALIGTLADRVVVTAPSYERAAPPDRVESALLAAGVAAEAMTVRASVAEALEQAHADAAEDDLVLVFGSLFTAAEARPWLREHARLMST